MSLFKRRPSKTPLSTVDEGGRSSTPSSPSSKKTGSRFGKRMSSTSDLPKHVDDWGRSISPVPAFSGGGREPFGSGFGVGDESEGTELQLIYGYTPLETTMELSISEVDNIVTRYNKLTRSDLLPGLDTPLILSSMALDISMEDSSSLIRAYLADINGWTYDLHLAAPLAVGNFMKWGLARLINDKGKRGFLPWEVYHEFKLGERAASYPPQYCSSSLISRLPKANAHLLSTILSLFSNIAAYSSSNGMTPRKLASLFAPYFFGLSDDKPFDETYTEWQKATDATEHILLAFVRDQKATSGRLPTHLEKFVVGYPQVLNISYAAGGGTKVPAGARVEEVTRIRRLARFHSRNLIQSAGTWEVPHSPDWTLFFPSPSSTASATNGSTGPATLYTPFYRHLLNIRPGISDIDDEGEIQKYKTVVQKEWSEFGELGFKDIESSKLEFDLSESERTRVKAKHETMDWGTFETMGFGRETFSPSDLIFRQNITATLQNWPGSKQVIDRKLRETEEALPPFPYDTTPHEEGRVFIDANFFEAWADVLVSGGWARDELKESSFALIQWRARPREGELAKKHSMSPTEDRTEERWVLLEEFVPREYRDELRDNKSKKQNKRISFLRTVRKKKEAPKLRLNASQITYPTYPSPTSSAMIVPPPPQQPSPIRQMDDSLFNAEGETKIVSLSNPNLDSGNSYAPSIISSTGAGHGHGTVVGSMSVHNQSNERLDDVAPPVPTGRRPSATPSVNITASAPQALPTSASVSTLNPPPPPPPKSASQLADAQNSPNHQPTPTFENNRDTQYSVETGETVGTGESEDPYGGIDDEEVQEGTVLFRGSRSYSRDLGQQGVITTLPEIALQQQQHGDDISSNRQQAEEALNGPRSPVGSPPTPPPGPALIPIPEGQATPISTRQQSSTSTSPLVAQTPGSLKTPTSSGSKSPAGSFTKRVPVPVDAIARPARHESLPPSPKPDADAPIDEEVARLEREKYASGASAFTEGTRVSKIIGLYEEKDKDKSVRLTQYGFGAKPSSP
ncbi:hypothetical protein MNV49_004213 [Pseudohyphozyma bogoriensis]|nr:hypothetical protein MNV49_004213 [Pseudohyphozyma bogoriensis]